MNDITLSLLKWYVIIKVYNQHESIIDSSKSNIDTLKLIQNEKFINIFKSRHTQIFVVFKYMIMLLIFLS